MRFCHSGRVADVRPLISDLCCVIPALVDPDRQLCILCCDESFASRWGVSRP